MALSMVSIVCNLMVITAIREKEPLLAKTINLVILNLCLSNLANSVMVKSGERSENYKYFCFTAHSSPCVKTYKAKVIQLVAAKYFPKFHWPLVQCPWSTTPTLWWPHTSRAPMISPSVSSTSLATGSPGPSSPGLSWSSPGSVFYQYCRGHTLTPWHLDNDSASLIRSLFYQVLSIWQWD